MDLTYWEEKGVDLSPFLCETYICDEETLVHHGSRQCDDLEYVPGSRLCSSTITTGDELCEKCWAESLSPASQELLRGLDQMEDAEFYRMRAVRGDVLGAGFTDLLDGLAVLPPYEGVAQWREVLREEFLSTWRDARAARPLGWRGTGPEGLLIVLSTSAINEVGIEERKILPHFWVAEREGPGTLFRGPAFELQKIYSLMRTGYTRPEFVASFGKLREKESESVIETALGLWDPGSLAMQSLESALDAARRV